ncbi:MAG TPA: 2Fe-2S iron-sulfur cluster-binding protein [Pyrinomonadaceae bacterium]|jgi:predicted molibdopterin-dependent oxidoreductase YjgC|nr:2Fe-2S iron-sulfur cluster-binding protein [Pyrinomonadaceae bacterium]HVQ55178.1 2Fe-2S iron-sulfur cluster-binding protein [Pyrinomonadaceae bacterium]
MTHPEIFEPYEKLIDVTVCGERRRVPENNSILRCLQFLEMEAVSDSELCWNGDCLGCQVWIKNGENEKAVMACRTNAEDGMEIVRLSETIRFA